MSAELMKSKFVRPSVAQLSLNLTYGFLSNFGCCFPCVIRSGEKTFFIFYEYLSFSLTWDPIAYGSEISKRYSSYKSQPKAFKLFLNFLPNGPRCDHVQLLEFWPMAKFHAQIWQFWKSAIIPETVAHRAKICSISTSRVRKRVYVQLLELWPMAKLVLNQSIKAHGPRVVVCVAIDSITWYWVSSYGMLFFSFLCTVHMRLGQRNYW